MNGGHGSSPEGGRTFRDPGSYTQNLLSSSGQMLSSHLPPYPPATACFFLPHLLSPSDAATNQAEELDRAGLKTAKGSAADASMRGVLVALVALAAAIAADAQSITVSTATQTSNQQQVTVTVSGTREVPQRLRVCAGLCKVSVLPLRVQSCRD